MSFYNPGGHRHFWSHAHRLLLFCSGLRCFNVRLVGVRYSHRLVHPRLLVLLPLAPLLDSWPQARLRTDRAECFWMVQEINGYGKEA